MGRGDKRTRRGKISKASFGNSRRPYKKRVKRTVSSKKSAAKTK